MQGRLWTEPAGASKITKKIYRRVYTLWEVLSIWRVLGANS